jgi:hypothetical protein
MQYTHLSGNHSDEADSPGGNCPKPHISAIVEKILALSGAALKGTKKHVPI